MAKFSRRDAIKAFASAGFFLVATPQILRLSKPEVTTPSETVSKKAQQASPDSVLRSSGKESMVIHVKDGKLIGYRGTSEFVFSDDELLARISAKFE